MRDRHDFATHLINRNNPKAIMTNPRAQAQQTKAPLARRLRVGLKRFLVMIREQKPQAVHDVKRAFVDGDHVTVHYHVRRWPGDAGWAVIDIFRIQDGLIAEHWDVMQDVVEGGPNPNGMF